MTKDRQGCFHGDVAAANIETGLSSKTKSSNFKPMNDPFLNLIRCLCA